MTKAKSSGGDFVLAPLAYRTAPHETTGVSPAHLLMGRRLRTTLLSLPGVLAPKVARRDTLQETDERSKQQQRKYYHQRTGAQPLRQVDIYDRVLVWDINTQTWRIPATVIQQFHGRSFRVRLANGTVLRRNRHQLQWRPDLSPTDEMALEGEDETEEANSSGVASGDKPLGESRVEQLASHEKKTRSGRQVKLQVWRKDYVT